MFAIKKFFFRNIRIRIYNMCRKIGFLINAVILLKTIIFIAQDKTLVVINFIRR